MASGGSLVAECSGASIYCRPEPLQDDGGWSLCCVGGALGRRATLDGEGGDGLVRLLWNDGKIWNRHQEEKTITAATMRMRMRCV